MMKLHQILAVLIFSTSLFFIPSFVLAESPEGEIYVIQEGDWLSKLSEKYYGNPFAFPAIVDATNEKALEGYNVSYIFNPDKIEVGQKVWIPSTQAYLDDTSNVHVVTNNGKDTQLTTEGIFENPKLASDNQTIGWLVITEYPEYEGGGISVAEDLVIYRDGELIKTLHPGGFIRAWQFWDNGEQVAIDFGGLYFAGAYHLFDIYTGEILEKSGDLDENPPEWANYFRRG